MISKQSWWAALAFAGAMSAVGSSARAQTVPLPNAYSFLGRIQGGQGKLVTYDANTQECRNVNVGNTVGLTGHVTITGTASTDSIHVVTSPTVICGFVLTSINTNGYSITIRAGGSGDIVDAGSAAFVTLVGDAGDDIINHQGPGGSLWGTGGNDFFFGGTNNSFFGEAGSDTMCAGRTVTVAQFNGGFLEAPSNNKHCGLGPVSNSTANCPACGM